MAATTATEVTTVCIKTRFGAIPAMAMVAFVGMVTTTGVTTASGSAIQGTNLTIEHRPILGGSLGPGSLTTTSPAFMPFLAATAEAPVCL